MHVGDIDVMIDVYIYIYCLLQWNVNFFLQFSGSLPSAMGKALSKDFSKKKFFAECLAAALGKVFFLNPEILCRVPKQGHSANKLF